MNLIFYTDEDVNIEVRIANRKHLGFILLRKIYFVRFLFGRLVCDDLLPCGGAASLGLDISILLNTKLYVIFSRFGCLFEDACL